MSDGDLSDVAVVAHILQSRMAAVTGAASLLRAGEALDAGQRAALLDVVEQSARGIEPAIRMLQYGMPAAALAELHAELRVLPTRSSGDDRPFPVPEHEDRRLASLERLKVLDRPVVPELERIARIGAAVVGVPAAFVNLIDARRQWQAAAVGGEAIEVPRGDAMCSVTVAEGRSIVVADASADPVFATNPWVTGVLGNVRLYVSIPLLTDAADAIGTICIVAEDAMSVAPEDVAVLEDLAALAMSMLEARLAAIELRGIVEAVARDVAV